MNKGKRMKKLIAVLFCLILSSSAYAGRHKVKMETIRYHGHTYIQLSTAPYGGIGITHDPDCNNSKHLENIYRKKERQKQPKQTAPNLGKGTCTRKDKDVQI
jgi:hypothetical protein